MLPLTVLQQWDAVMVSRAETEPNYYHVAPSTKRLKMVWIRNGFGTRRKELLYSISIRVPQQYHHIFHSNWFWPYSSSISSRLEVMPCIISVTTVTSAFVSP